MYSKQALRASRNLNDFTTYADGLEEFVTFNVELRQVLLVQLGSHRKKNNYRYRIQIFNII